MKDDDKLVLVEKDMLDQMIKDQQKLRALESVGVDSWEGYEVAMDTLKEED